MTRHQQPQNVADEICAEVERGFRQDCEKRKVKRQLRLPNQDEAAQTVAIQLRDKPPWQLYSRAKALAEVAEHLRVDRRRLLADACRIQIGIWEALAAKFEAPL